MKVLWGKSFQRDLGDGKHIDVSVYPSKWTTLVKMDVWQKGNASALSFGSKRYFNLERFISDHRAKAYINRRLNAQYKDTVERSIYNIFG